MKVQILDLLVITLQPAPQNPSEIKYSNLTFYCNSQDTNLFVFFRQFYWTPIQSFCQEHFNIVYKYFEVIGSFVAPL